MPRALICLPLHPHAPGLSGAGTLSPFGHWLRVRVRRTSTGWPAVRFLRLCYTAREARLVLGLHHRTPPLVAALAVSRALMRETEEAARRAGWIGADAVLWDRGREMVWCGGA